MRSRVIGSKKIEEAYMHNAIRIANPSYMDLEVGKEVSKWF